MKISHILGCFFALGLSMPGLSQSADHGQHGEHASKTKNSSKAEATEGCTPEHAAMGHCKLDKEKAVQVVEPRKPKAPSTDPSCTPEHAAMGHCTPKKSALPKGEQRESGTPKPLDKTSQPNDPDCAPEHAAMGHCTPKKPAASTGKPDESGATKPSDKASQPNDPDCTPEHAAMGHCTPKTPTAESKANVPATGTNLPAGNAPAPEAPEANYADRIWGKEAMAPVRADMYNEHGGMISSMFLLDLAATRFRDGEDGYQWDAEAWLGGDLNRIVIKSEGESYGDEGVEEAEVQAVYSRAIGPYFDFQAGVRHDFRPEPSKTYLALGFEGLAPYWNEIEATLFISDKGHAFGRLEGRYDQLITQRFVLETVGEINLSTQESKDEDIGSGLVDAELSLRLRYEIEREIAPYLGVSWKGTFGETARLARASGEGEDHSSLLVGLRVWM
jgi:copper resistance protein B